MIKYKYLMVMAIFAMSGCSASEADTGTLQPKDRVLCKEPRPAICTMDYRPVCGLSKDETEKTYSNGCSACSNPEVIAYIPGACAE